MRKMYLVICVCLVTSVCPVKAQKDGVNIWEIIHGFYVEIGERDSNSQIYPEFIEGKGTAYPCFIYASGEDIRDPDFVLPYYNELDYYSFGPLFTNKNENLLFFKEGKWHFINMNTPLPEIMSQCVDLCNKLSLTDKESIYAFKETLRMHEVFRSGINDIRGAPIDTNDI